MLEISLLGWTFIDAVWYVFAVVAFFVALLLMILILLQDSKDTGLTSAFGGGSSSSLLGARMQKDLAKLTGILGGILTICLISMSIITAKFPHGSIAAAGAVAPPPNKTDAPAPGAGNPFGLGGTGGLTIPDGFGGGTPTSPAGGTGAPGLNPVTPGSTAPGATQPGATTPGLAPRPIPSPTAPPAPAPSAGSQPGATPAVTPSSAAPGTATPPATPGAAAEAPPANPPVNPPAPAPK